ncbi:MAG: phenylalanine--tRNA ligase subunit alpha [Candidatus Paceibacterota bacterium]|jgi:phenylalanyl-tRNA synthetase alpha chain
MNIDEIKKSFSDDLEKAKDQKAVEDIRIKYLGRQKGKLTEILRSLKDLSVEKRRETGPLANALRKEIEESLTRKTEQLQTTNYKLQTNFDITRPGLKLKTGRLHLLTKVDREIRQIFSSMNFSVVEGPEVEDEFHNFDALNIPKDHPARDSWNTFWLKNSKLLLRTHTSPVQIRYMEKNQPPFQIIVPGKVFRYEATDSSHETNFYQVEGLMVGENISLANFKFVIEEFFKKFFQGQKIEFRFRPSYFPFVEPGVEVDIKLKGKWLEVMGAGMVHPNVFEAVGYNHYELTGFAFGMGLERLAMIKYGVPDIRLFHSGDLRFIKQF